MDTERSIEPPSDFPHDSDAVVADAEQIVRVARVLRKADWPGYRDTDDE